MPARIESNPIFALIDEAISPRSSSPARVQTDQLIAFGAGLADFLGGLFSQHAGDLSTTLGQRAGDLGASPHAQQLFGLANILSDIFTFAHTASRPQHQAAPTSRASSDDGVRTTGHSGAGSFEYGIRDGVRREVSYSGNGLTARASADASAYANVRGQGQVQVGPDGLVAEGMLEGRVGVTAGADASVESALGSAAASARATAEAYGRLQGRAELNGTGADITASASVGATATATANARVASAPILGMTGQAQASASASSGTGANASGEAVLTYNPPQALVRGDAGAFAGARAGASADAGFGPVKAHYGVEARAGLGADAHFEAGIKGDKLKIDFGLGAALGIGLGFNLQLEIDVKPVTDLLGGIFSGIASLFGGGKGDGAHAAKTVGDFVQKMGTEAAPITRGTPSPLPTSNPGYIRSESWVDRPKADEPRPEDQDEKSWNDSGSSSWSGSEVVSA